MEGGGGRGPVNQKDIPNYPDIRRHQLPTVEELLFAFQDELSRDVASLPNRK